VSCLAKREWIVRTPDGEAASALEEAGCSRLLARLLSNRGRVILHDQYASIAGNVSMDLTMIDVTDIPQTAIGDEVLLIGRSPRCSVGADDQAFLAGTIVYEILCGLSPRVPRVYVE